MNPIDLRSDTVTRPGAAMRAAIAAAPVGDDQYGDDPSVNRLQARIAECLGKPAALWFATGTQANQVALRLLTRPGDDVIVAREAHSVWHEAGGSAANGGVHFTEIGERGVFSVEQMRGAIKPRNLDIFAPTSLVQIENTHNRMGGVIFPQSQVVDICAAARAHGLASYLDGARLWTVSAATGLPVAELAAPFDLVMVSMSKGLGAPAGSLLAGPRELIGPAVRHRRMLGGAMRQAGLLAAGAEYALDHHLARLVDDHASARMLGERLAASCKVVLDAASIQTNIVVFGLGAEAPPAGDLVMRARERGVLINALNPRTIRLVTHLDAPYEACERAATLLLEILED